MITAPLTGHLDAALTEFAKGFSQNGLVSDLVAPRVPVGRQTDKYWIYGRENQMLIEQQLRATGAAAQRIRMSLSSDSYFCPSHALAADIADEDRAGYTAGDLEQDATQTLMDKILLQKEVELAALLTDVTKVTNNTTLQGGDQFSDAGNSDPGTVVETAKSLVRESGVEANTLVLGEPVYTKLVHHPAILDQFKYTTPGAIGVTQLAGFFAVDRVLVARAVQVDKAGAVSFVWGKDAVLLYVSPTASRKDTSAVKTFVWQAAPGTVDGIGVVTGRNPDPTAKADIVGVDFYYQQKITAVETAYLIKAAVL